MTERSSFDWDIRFRNDETPWERSGLHPAAETWIRTGVLAPGQSVIIPGCGRCPEVEAFARAGLTVTAGDLSETALAWQSSRLSSAGLSAQLISGDMLEGAGGLWLPDVPVDRVYEQTFLCAIPPRLRETYEAALCRWLKPGGQLLVLFMQKQERGGPPYGCPLDAMHALFPESRWEWPAEADFVPYPHPSLNGKPELGGILVRR
jgi:methyl halide transferase